MEITAKPRRGGWPRVLRVVLVIGAMWAVALLIPPALGLQAHVSDRAMAGTPDRGSLVFDQQIDPMQLAVGDVVTFVPPGADPGAGPVTRQVVAIGDTHFSTRGDATGKADRWRVPLTEGDLQRVAFSLPWVGYPIVLLGAVTVPTWLPAALIIGLAAGLVLLRGRSRTAAGEEPRASDVAARSRSGAAATRPLA